MSPQPFNTTLKPLSRVLSYVLTLSIVASLLLAVPRQTKACGPFFSDAIFVFSKHPDFPLERYAQGQIGVLRSSYARSYLVVAYRTFAGAPPNAEEQTALKELWNDRLGNSGELDDSAWINTWTDARKKVPGAGEAGNVRAFRNREKPHEYEGYLNCQQDAFETAAATLNDRVTKYGADSAAVRDWVAAQDKVFANCGEGKHIPEVAAADAAGWLSSDRHYQIAAANFYAGSFDDAVRGFDEIARDAGSPWRQKAPYLAARSLIRKASLADKEEDGKPALAEAETRLNAIVRDKAGDSTAAARLLNLCRLRLHPDAKRQELAASISGKGHSANLKQDVWDYTVLLDKILSDENVDVSKQAIPAGFRSDDLTDWIVTLQDESSDAAPHAAERWQRTHALPWLVVAMVNATAKQDGVEALMNDAAGVDRTSPAFSTLAFHRIQLLTEMGRSSEARTILDGILANDRARLPASAVNLFLGQRMELAESLEDFLKSAQRVPAAISDDNDGRELPDDPDEQTPKEPQYLFDTDATDILNRAAPAAVLQQAALSRTLAPNLRRDVAQATFMRAALVDDRQTAGQAATLLAELHPELKTLLASYQRAATPDARRFTAAYVSLKFPGLRPYVTAGVGRGSGLGEMDSYRNNWWCAAPQESFRSPSEGAAPATPPRFLAGSQAVAVRQLGMLKTIGTGPNHFCRTAIEWAATNPADPRIPEALHLAVKSTRYGCTDKETGRWSKAAFDLLHRRYGNTSWARETKYWFKD